jgi:hypothetical protein
VGNAFTGRKNLKEVADAATKDAAEQSAIKMAAAPELLKLTQLAEQPQPIAEMRAAEQAAAPTLPATRRAPVPAARAGDDPERYTLEYVHSAREWKHSVRLTLTDTTRLRWSRSRRDV